MRMFFRSCLTLALLLTLAACSARGNGQPEPRSSSATAGEVESEASSDGASISASGSPGDVSDGESVGGKTLIAYFSLIDIVPDGADAVTHATPSLGNTAEAAAAIQELVGGDVFAIHTVQDYPVFHQEASDIAEEEMRSDARPELSDRVDNMDEYDIVYLGYPIWWYAEPMAIRTFLEAYDFSGKTIVPFCTSLGAGVSESVENIKLLAPDATVLDGIALRTGREDMGEDIAAWLSEIGMTN